ncbi:nucleotidyl transferase AbiEii/AbiGii toxin family protein [bacterium]|nr:nucleotidyl transferase AbiEii/AbiGii toxin family protein [bacterium]
MKIDPNIIIRSTVYPSNSQSLSQKVKSTFKQEVDMLVLNEAGLYGRKICGAFDRQHPRDLVDIYLMFQNDKIKDQIQKAFLVYLISHPRPISALLSPNFKDIKGD